MTEPCRRVRAPLPGKPVRVWKPIRGFPETAVERLLRRNPHLKVKR